MCCGERGFKKAASLSDGLPSRAAAFVLRETPRKPALDMGPRLREPPQVVRGGDAAFDDHAPRTATIATCGAD